MVSNRIDCFGKGSGNFCLFRTGVLRNQVTPNVTAVSAKWKKFSEISGANGKIISKNKGYITYIV